MPLAIESLPIQSAAEKVEDARQEREFREKNEYGRSLGNRYVEGIT
jgi:hypothetical protein